MKIALLIVVLMFSFNNLVGQISPQFDDMWVIQRDISDEFNEEKLDNDKWIKPPYNWGGDGHYYYFRMENVKVENGELLLIADTANSNRPFYYSGGIQSKSNDYSFGYYELKAILLAYEKMESNVEKGSGLVSGRIIKKETAIVLLSMMRLTFLNLADINSRMLQPMLSDGMILIQQTAPIP